MRDKMYNNFIYNTRYFNVIEALNDRTQKILDPFSSRITIAKKDASFARCALLREVWDN